MDEEVVAKKKMEALTFKPEIKILLVDDREDNLFSIHTVLEKDGYKLVKAKSGMEALKILLKEVDFSLILMDVQMPGLSGHETASLIYERDLLKHIPVIFITANDYNEELVFKGYKAGAVDYIYKPINPDLLRAKVAVFVELYRKTHLLMEQERKLQKINSELEKRVRERTDELLRKNKELEKTNEELKRVNNDLDSFVYAASHDLKAPVSNIEGLLTTLQESIPQEVLTEENVTKIMDMISQSISRFKGTILDLTEITKIQKSQEEDINTVNILEVIEDVKVGIRELILRSTADIRIYAEGCTEIKFSKKNLNSILYNLITNSIKYKSPDRAPVVEIQLNELDQFMVMTVKDNGLGFNPSDKFKIFTMFKRLHNHVEGIGVGLYIVKKIVENTGGKIEVDSIPGEGSVFKVYFKNTLKFPELTDA